MTLDRMGRRVSTSMRMPSKVLIRLRASAPAATAARAISVISVTLGLSFTINGFFAYFLEAETTSSTILGWVPNAMPPHLTFGQEMFISIRSTSASEIFSIMPQYSSTVLPDTLAMILVSYWRKNGICSSIKRSMPGFCRPTQFKMPIGVSAMRGAGLPRRSVGVRPLTPMPPSSDRSKNSPYSWPKPKVPEAVVIGFLSSTPQIFTRKSITKRPPCCQIPGHPCRHGHTARLLALP